MKIVDVHPNLSVNRSFVREAAFLHDIRIFLTDASTVQCFGEHPHITYGYLGAGLLRKEGFERHALVCERHTGAELTLEEIIERRLPAPHREMVPVTLEGQIICFADKFFFKTHLDEGKIAEKARKSTIKYDEEDLSRSDGWCSLLL